MPNPFTRVPDRPVPILSGNRRLIAAANLFMRLTWSTPKSGTLADTWVTPSSIWLATGTSGLLAIAGVLSLGRGISERAIFTVVLGPVLLLLAALSLSVAVLGIVQRRARP